MSVANIRSRLHTLVDGVTNVGRVYDYERWINEQGDFLDIFRVEIGGIQVIRGWTIGYEGLGIGSDEFPNGYMVLRADGTSAVLRRHEFKVRGYMGWDDAEESEKVFSDLVETVLDTLDADDTLHDGGTYYFASPAIVAVEPRVFGGVLVHFAEITQLVEEVRL
jgi:hypothetical protein